MTKKTKVIWGFVSVVGMVGLGFTAKHFICSNCQVKRQALSLEQKLSLATELVRIVSEEPNSILREWLLKQSPIVSKQAILSLDNKNDPVSRARLAALSAIYSMDAGGLSEEARLGWALVLRELAQTMLHPGETRLDYVAKSYLFEGRTKEAAATYRLIPETASAKYFFGENPELRGPASKYR